MKENIMLTDFGSARYEKDVTAQDRIEGTKEYIAPEVHLSFLSPSPTTLILLLSHLTSTWNRSCLMPGIDMKSLLLNAGHRHGMPDSGVRARTG